MITEPEPYLLVTPEQYQKGWIELHGVTPIHHSYICISRLANGNYVVRNPRLQISVRKRMKGFSHDDPAST